MQSKVIQVEVQNKTAHLFDIEPRARYGFQAIGNYNLYGDKYIEVPNEPDALVITYSLRAKDDAGARVTISDIKGTEIAQLKGPSEAGLNRVLWNMRAGTAATSGRGGRGGGGPTLPVGDYRITVEVAGQKETTIGRIRERLR